LTVDEGTVEVEETMGTEGEGEAIATTGVRSEVEPEVEAC
jgi:hypothetical protein